MLPSLLGYCRALLPYRADTLLLDTEDLLGLLVNIKLPHVGMLRFLPSLIRPGGGRHWLAVIRTPSEQQDAGQLHHPGSQQQQQQQQQLQQWKACETPAAWITQVDTGEYTASEESTEAEFLPVADPAAPGEAAALTAAESIVAETPRSLLSNEGASSAVASPEHSSQQRLEEPLPLPCVYTWLDSRAGTTEGGINLAVSELQQRLQEVLDGGGEVFRVISSAGVP